MVKSKLPRIEHIKQEDEIAAGFDKDNLHSISFETDNEVIATISKAFHSKIKCALVVAVKGGINEQPKEDDYAGVSVFGLANIEDMANLGMIANEYIKKGIMAMVHRGLATYIEDRDKT